MARDGSTPAQDLGGTFTDLSVGDDGRMRVTLYRPDRDAAIQTLTDGRVSTAAGDATTIPAGPARLDALALSGGTLYTADDSSRRKGVLLRSTLSAGPAGASASTPSRVLAYTGGLVHQTLAAAGGRVLVEQGSPYEPGHFQVYENGELVGTPLNYYDVSTVSVVDFDGEHVLVSDKTTATDGTLLLHTFADGRMQRVPSGSALYGGAVYSSVRNGTTSTWSIRRTDLTTGKVTTAATVNCLPGSLQVRGSRILLTTCGAATTTGLLLTAGSSATTTVDASVRTPILGTDVLYTFTKASGSAAITLNAQSLTGAETTAHALFTLPDRANSAAAERWTVDRDAPWAAWMDDSGVTHVTWAGVPTAAKAATTPGRLQPQRRRFVRQLDPDLDLRPSGELDAHPQVRLHTGPFTHRNQLHRQGRPVLERHHRDRHGRHRGRLHLDADRDRHGHRPARRPTPPARSPCAGPSPPPPSPHRPSRAAREPPRPLPVTWAAKTAGVKSYDIAWRVTTRNSAGAWTLGPLQTWRTATTATSATFGRANSPIKPVPGVTYRFYVRAHDDAGQTGAWSRTATTGIPLDDRASALHYTGTWKSASSTAAWAGTVRTSATKGAYVSFTANGTQLRVVATKKSNGAASRSWWTAGRSARSTPTRRRPPTAKWSSRTPSAPRSSPTRCSSRSSQAAPPPGRPSPWTAYWSPFDLTGTVRAESMLVVLYARAGRCRDAVVGRNRDGRRGGRPGGVSRVGERRESQQGKPVGVRKLCSRVHGDHREPG
ncbi:hypothetical protein ACRAWF_21035 [Streptomyces sp. L7]